MELFVFGAKKAFKIAKNDQKPDFKKLMGGNSLSYGWKKKVWAVVSHFVPLTSEIWSLFALKPRKPLFLAFSVQQRFARPLFGIFSPVALRAITFYLSQTLLRDPAEGQIAPNFRIPHWPRFRTPPMNT